MLRNKLPKAVCAQNKSQAPASVPRASRNAHQSELCRLQFCRAVAARLKVPSRISNCVPARCSCPSRTRVHVICTACIALTMMLTVLSTCRCGLQRPVQHNQSCYGAWSCTGTRLLNVGNTEALWAACQLSCATLKLLRLRRPREQMQRWLRKTGRPGVPRPGSARAASPAGSGARPPQSLPRPGPPSHAGRRARTSPSGAPAAGDCSPAQVCLYSAANEQARQQACVEAMSTACSR